MHRCTQTHALMRLPRMNAAFLLGIIRNLFALLFNFYNFVVVFFFLRPPSSPWFTCCVLLKWMLNGDTWSRVMIVSRGNPCHTHVKTDNFRNSTPLASSTYPLYSCHTLLLLPVVVYAASACRHSPLLFTSDIDTCAISKQRHAFCLRNDDDDGDAVAAVVADVAFDNIVALVGEHILYAIFYLCHLMVREQLVSMCVRQQAMTPTTKTMLFKVLRNVYVKCGNGSCGMSITHTLSNTPIRGGSARETENDTHREVVSCWRDICSSWNKKTKSGEMISVDKNECSARRSARPKRYECDSFALHRQWHSPLFCFVQHSFVCCCRFVRIVSPWRQTHISSPFQSISHTLARTAVHSHRNSIEILSIQLIIKHAFG